MRARPGLRATFAVLALIMVDALHPGVASASTAPANLIRDTGAERAFPNGGGTVDVPSWKPDPGTFTAVAYGTSGGFPDASSHGPLDRGNNFFSGGTGSIYSIAGATQNVAITDYLPLIQAGNAKYVLSGWFGGYSTQRDYAWLDLFWEDAQGGAIGTDRLGPVTVTERHGVTCLLYRTTTGNVPTKAVKARVHLHMARQDGSYIDGYADNLRLVIQPS